MENTAAIEKTASDHPLVMAYIGDDDPHRGDSKAAIGLAKLVAEMLDGRYVYVDKVMLDKSFPFCRDIGKQLEKFAGKTPCPDVLIGTQQHQLERHLSRPPKVQVASINECLSNQWLKGDSREKREIQDKTGRRYGGGLVSHHLTEDLLATEAKKIRQHYPKIKGELVAVLMGGGGYYTPRNYDETAEKLKDIASHYPDGVTFFLCPSRRTRKDYKSLFNALDESSLTKTLNSPIRFLKSLFGKAAQPNKMNVTGVEYEKSIKTYNPYLGLLGAADHIVVTGDSVSLVSESLFTGKNIYLLESDTIAKLI
jgi:hypothetical protein